MGLVYSPFFRIVIIIVFQEKTLALKIYISFRSPEKIGRFWLFRFRYHFIPVFPKDWMLLS